MRIVVMTEYIYIYRLQMDDKDGWGAGMGGEQCKTSSRKLINLHAVVTSSSPPAQSSTPYSGSGLPVMRDIPWAITESGIATLQILVFISFVFANDKQARRRRAASAPPCDTRADMMMDIHSLDGRIMDDFIWVLTTANGWQETIEFFFPGQVSKRME